MGLNAALVVVKLLAGILGHSYALVADAIESSTDISSSLVVWAGLRVTQRPADEDYPYGSGKAEALAAAVVSCMLPGAALGIAAAAVHQIVTPHHPPAPFTPAVLALVVIAEEVMSRKVLRVGAETASTAVKADAWHHRRDALTSAAAFAGIAVALIGGPGWESADDWAALVASVIIALNGGHLLRSAARERMDRMTEGPWVEQIAAAALEVEGVCAIEKLMVRTLGLDYFVDLDVQADPALPLREAHVLSGRVKGAIRSAAPGVTRVLIHMEPCEADQSRHEVDPCPRLQ
jgi:cation diffusion facilitator family transporter